MAEEGKAQNSLNKMESDVLTKIFGLWDLNFPLLFFNLLPQKRHTAKLTEES